LTLAERRAALEPGHPRLSLRRQCALLRVSRSGTYYRPAAVSPEDQAEEEKLRTRMFAIFTRAPVYGYRRMTAQLHRDGHAVNGKRVHRLMREMGLSAIYPKRRLSVANQQHRKYPYLLSGVKIERPDQVWSSDITYIRLPRGFCYLTVVMDWHSRRVLSWELSASLETDFCLVVLDRALSSGRRPEIFNTDQGCQYTSEAFTGRLASAGIRISMDGKGRCFDNIFTERLWRTVKYEEVFLKEYLDLADARRELGKFFSWYNGERLHQSLDYRTPTEIYEGRFLLPAG
jgi:putative transposase